MLVERGSLLHHLEEDFEDQLMMSVTAAFCHVIVLDEPKMWLEEHAFMFHVVVVVVVVMVVMVVLFEKPTVQDQMHQIHFL